MKYLIILIILVITFSVPYFRCAFLNPFKTLFYGITDFLKYFLYRKYKIPKTGSITCYSAHFGKGKTLSAVDFLVSVYKKYNGFKVYDEKLKKWQTIRIIVLSNVDIKKIPYIPLKSLSQITDIFKVKSNDDFKIYHYVLIDEASVQLNSRNFKTNIDAIFLNSLLTCRHFNGNIIYTSQKFKLTDALLRSVTQKVIQCNKIWRLCILREYDADELEQKIFPRECKIIRTRVYFATNKKYNAYDTTACVDDLIKDYQKGAMLSNQEILDSFNFDYVSRETSRPRFSFFKKSK